MLGKRSPTFEKCVDGKYGQCEASSLDIVGIAVAVACVGLALLAACTVLNLWLRRRHGNLAR